MHKYMGLLVPLSDSNLSEKRFKYIGCFMHQNLTPGLVYLVVGQRWVLTGTLDLQIFSPTVEGSVACICT